MRPLALLPLAVAVTAQAALAAEPGDPGRGLDYARANCSECHGVEPTGEAGPFFDLPTFREIAATPGMSDLALFSFFQTTHPTMPDFIVPSADVRDLIAYFASLRR